MVFNAVGLRILKSLKVNSSNTASVQQLNSFFINNRNMTANSVEKHCFVVLDTKLQVKIKLNFAS